MSVDSQSAESVPIRFQSVRCNIGALLQLADIHRHGFPCQTAAPATALSHNLLRFSFSMYGLGGTAYMAGLY